MIGHFSRLAIGSDYAASQTGYGATSGSGGMSFASFVAGIIGVINTLIPMLITVGILIFFVGLIEYIYHSDNVTARTRGVGLIKWGLVAMFVLMSLWGILDVAKNSIFPS